MQMASSANEHAGCCDRPRVDGDRADAEFTAGRDHPQRDLSAICDQDFLEHRLARPHSEQRQTILDRLAVLGDDLDDFARNIALNLVHQLHGLHDAEHLADLNQSPTLTKGATPGAERS